MPDTLLAALARMDVALFQWLRAYHTPALDTAMAALSDIARQGRLWLLLLIPIGFIVPGRWPAIFRTLLAIGLSALMTDHALKPLADRARPFETYADITTHGVTPTTRSMPSGHASNAVAAAYGLSRVVPRASAIFWLLALLVGFSRIYLGLHYPADVLVGALVGLAAGVFATGGQLLWRRSADAP